MSRTLNCILFGIIGFGFLGWAPLLVHSQQPRKPRPLANLMRVEKLSLELEEMLKEWELHSSKIKRLSGKFSRFTYQKTFQVEKRAVGEFKHEAPDKGSYKVWPAKVTRRDKPTKKDKLGRPYTLQPDQPDSWLSTGTEIFKINESEKTYEVFPIPPEQQGENIIEGPLPFLFGMKAESAKRRYHFRLLKPIEETSRYIFIEVKPRRRQDRANYQKAWLVLDRQTYLPKNIRLWDPAGTTVRDHHFGKMDVNPNNPWWNRKRKFIQPNLKGFTRIDIGNSGDSPGRVKIRTGNRTSGRFELDRTKNPPRRSGYRGANVPRSTSRK